MFRGTGQGLFLMLPSTGHKDFLCFMVRDMNLFWKKNLSNCIIIISRGGNSHRLRYEMCHF